MPDKLWKTFTFAGIYSIVHVDSGKVYVGQALNIARRIYRHYLSTSNCVRLSRAIQCYGWDSFEVKLLERVDDISLLDEREQHFIDFFHAADSDIGYNICPLVSSHKGVPHTAESKAKISAALKGKPKSLSYRLSQMGHPVSEEARAKIRAARIGKPLSDEHRIEISKANLGRQFSDEHRANLSAALMGHSVSAETRAKLSRDRIGLHPSAEKRAAQHVGHEKRYHMAEKTAILLRYITENKNASFVDIKNALNLPRSTARNLALKAGWRRIDQRWQMIGYETGDDIQC